jgi:hypothetical protein
LLLLGQGHVVEADLALVLFTMTGIRSVVHETIVRHLRKVLRLLLRHFAATSLTDCMDVLLLIVVHI